MLKNGTVGDKLNFSLSGTLPTQREGTESQPLTLAFRFPEDFPYRMSQSPQEYRGYANWDSGKDTPLYFQASSASYSVAENKHILLVFVICAEKEFIVLNWADREQYYLVASTDPNADVQELLAYYLEYQSILQQP